MVQTREEKKAACAAYYQKNKDKWKTYDCNQSDYRADWYQKNKEKVLANVREYQIENADDIKAKKAIYHQTKNFKVKGWIKKGLIDDYDMVWDRYCNTLPGQIDRR